MNHTRRTVRTLWLAGLLVAVAAAPGCFPPEPETAPEDESSLPGGEVGDEAALPDDAGESDLTAREVEHLLFVREEEKLARDVYLTLHELWGSRVFANIAGSEQVHTDRILALLEAYGLDDPVGDNGRGVFTDPTLQALHDELVALGARSELDAFLVGGLIEETDIADIAESIADTHHADIVTVFENLMAGSGNHLRAFAARIERETGAPYAAQVLAAEEVSAILAE